MTQLADSKIETQDQDAGGTRRSVPRWIITLSSVAVLTLLWEWFGRDINPVFGSYPSAIAVAFWDLASSGKLGEAMLQSLHSILHATLVGGQLHILVPEGVSVEVIPSRHSGRLGADLNPRPAPAPQPGTPLIEVRSFSVAGQVKVHAPRRPSGRWRGRSPRRPAGPQR